MARLQRTNIVLDQELVERAKELYGFATTRETIDYALRRIVGGSVDPYELAKKLEGSMILPPLEEIRGVGKLEDL